MAARAQPLPVRFWRKVQKTPSCWPWTGATTPNGYGVIARGSREEGNVLTHVLSYEMHYGPVPPGKRVLHRCDVNYPPGDVTYRRCVRPDHLWVGTVADNQTDMAEKGRAPRGERQPKHRLTEDDVRRIRATTFVGSGGWPHRQGITFAQLAAEYGTSEASIRDAYHRRTWKHLP